MSIVVIERVWDRAYTAEELQAIYRDTSWCFSAHGVRSRVHMLAADGRRGCCMLDAPDAEAVRTARRKLGVVDAERLWPADVADSEREVTDLSRRSTALDPGTALLLFERAFQQRPAAAELKAMEEGTATRLASEGGSLLARLFARDGRRMICLFAAPNLDAAHRANADLPYERAWPATIHFD